MEAPLTLRRPSNWQNFESLCKKLWGEKWNCPEIQQNGRLGQEQSGVDIFGIPQGETAYFGIQCKGKSEYNDSHPQFTEQEIITEIEKAKNFEPKLKKLYFATTALNDSKIQSFVRQKNIEHINTGLFEVHMFCWETIVDLIDENRHTRNWYLSNQNYKTNKSIKVTFDNGSSEVYGDVPFKQVITNYEYAKDHAVNNIALALSGKLDLGLVTRMEKPTVDWSYYRFHLKVQNTGNDPIKDFKLLLNFKGEFQDITVVNRSSQEYSFSTFISSEDKTGKICPPINKILVGGDTISSDYIFIKPFHEESSITIDWELISIDFREKGELRLTLTPNVEQEFVKFYVDDPTKVGIKEGLIENVIKYQKEME